MSRDLDSNSMLQIVHCLPSLLDTKKQQPINKSVIFRKIHTCIRRLMLLNCYYIVHVMIYFSIYQTKHIPHRISYIIIHVHVHIFFSIIDLYINYFCIKQIPTKLSNALVIVKSLLCDLNIFEQKVQIQSLMFQNWAKWLTSIYKASDNTNVVNNAISQILRHITRDVHLKNVLF